MPELNAGKIVRSPGFHSGISLLTGVGAFGITALVSKYLKNNSLALWHVGLGVGSLTFAATLMTLELALPVEAPSHSSASGSSKRPDDHEGSDPYGGDEPKGQPVTAEMGIIGGQSASYADSAAQLRLADVDRQAASSLLGIGREGDRRIGGDSENVTLPGLEASWRDSDLGVFTDPGPFVNLRAGVSPQVSQPIQPGRGGAGFAPGRRPSFVAPMSDAAENLTMLKEVQVKQLRSVGPYLLQDPASVDMLSAADKDSAIKTYLIEGMRNNGESWDGFIDYYDDVLRLTTEEERWAAVQVWNNHNQRAVTMPHVVASPAVPVVPQVEPSQAEPSQAEPSQAQPADSQSGEERPVGMTFGDVTVNEEKLKERPASLDLSAVPEEYKRLDGATLGQRLTKALDTYDPQVDQSGRPIVRNTILGACRQAAGGGDAAADRILLERLRYILFLVESDGVSNAIKSAVLIAINDKFRACRPTWNQEARSACLALMGGEEREGGRELGIFKHYVQALKENLVREYLTTTYRPEQHHCFNYVERHLYDQLGLDREDGLADEYGDESWSRHLDLSRKDHRDRFVIEFKRDYWTPQRIVEGLREQLNSEQVEGINANIQLMLFGLIPEDGDPDDYSALWVETRPEVGAKLTEAGVIALLVHAGHLVLREST